jgi:hypothetical protein
LACSRHQVFCYQRGLLRKGVVVKTYPLGKPGRTGRFRFGAIVVLFAHGSIGTRQRSWTPRTMSTRRGNARQFILTTDAERLVYLDLLRQIPICGPAPLFIAERRRQKNPRSGKR